MRHFVMDKYLTDEEQQWYEDAGYDNGERVGSDGRTADRMPVVLHRLAGEREALEGARRKLEALTALANESYAWHGQVSADTILAVLGGRALMSIDQQSIIVSLKASQLDLFAEKRDLERQLAEARRERDARAEVAGRLLQERNEAQERGKEAWKWAMFLRQSANLTIVRERDEAQGKLAVLMEQLRQFSEILAVEVTHGTLKLGFGPDWPAKKVQLAIDRILGGKGD